MPGLFKRLILFLTLLFLISCTTRNSESDKISIAVSIPPYKYLVEKIGGNKVNIVTSIPPGATPHQYEPTPKMIQSVSSMDYYFAVGGNMEFEEVWLDKLKGINKELTVYDLSKNITYIHNDPHIWLSIQRVKTISENIYNALSKISSNEKEIFTKNYNALVDSINVVEAELRNSLSEIENKKLLVYHGSWTYFADEFGFKQISIEHGSKSASAKEFKEILDEVKQSEIPVIFVDPQHSKSSAEVIAKDLKIKLDVIDPLAMDLLSNLIKVKNKIVKYYK